MIAAITAETMITRATLICRRNIPPKVGFRMGEEMATFGYARVSTRDQDLASQVAALQAAGCGNIFKEKASGAKTDRPELAKAIRRLEAGDLWSSRGWIGWRDRPGICSTSSMRSPKLERVSSHWPMLGPTRRPRTASYC